MDQQSPLTQVAYVLDRFLRVHYFVYVHAKIFFNRSVQEFCRSCLEENKTSLADY